MIVTCSSCLTKFRLDDSRISHKGTKVRCSRCHYVFLVAPPIAIKEESLEDFNSADQTLEALLGSDQQKLDVSLPSKTETIKKAAKGQMPPSSHKEIRPDEEKHKLPDKPLKEERITVKTFKIDNNSFRIEWNIRN